MNNRAVTTMTCVLVGASVVGLVPALRTPATLVVVMSMPAAIVIGVRAWRPPESRPWYLLGASALVALVCALLAPASPTDRRRRSWNRFPSTSWPAPP